MTRKTNKEKSSTFIHKIKDGDFKTQTDVLRDDWRSKGRGIFESKHDSTKTLIFNNNTGLCRIC